MHLNVIKVRAPIDSKCAHVILLAVEAIKPRRTETMTNDTDARTERMMRELQSDLADMVRSGDLTETEANEWANAKADQWAKGLN